MCSKIVKCPECKGKGYTIDSFVAVATLGIGFLMPGGHFYDRECPRCDGKSYIKITL